MGDSWWRRRQFVFQESRYSFRIFFKDKLAVAGLCAIVAMWAVAIFAPVIAPFPAQGRGEEDVKNRLEAPSWEHWLGTDEAGRDILSRVIYGARIPLLVSAAVAIGVLAIGVPLGGLAGYFGGFVDEAIMRVTDVVLAFPTLVLAMALVVVLGPSVKNAAIALLLTWWPWYTRLVRSVAVSLRQRPYVLAAKAMGIGGLTIVRRHILPNAFGPVAVQVTLDMGAVILAVAGLSFIGLGAQPPTPEWGLMVSEGRAYILVQWWMSTFPGLAILILVLAYNLVGDGVRDVMDPRTRR
jgi:peptide/nickel transport system permease protein